jgi:predicted acetyltransferase
VKESEFILRTCTHDDLPELLALVAGAFLGDADEDFIEVRRMTFEPDRRHVIVDGDRIVAGAGVQTREMTVPGGPVPTAHVTAVAVAATHRRRGLMTRLMSEQLQAIRDRGTEPIAALWASEGPIYGRFGYGLASWNVRYALPTMEASLPGQTPPGQLRQAVPVDVRKTLAEIHAGARMQRPGISERSDIRWESRTIDPASRRGPGMSAQRAVVYEDDDGPKGYALWRSKIGWGTTGANGEVEVTELIAPGIDAYAALWRFLLSIDLVRTVRSSFAAVDEPLAHLLTNAYALGATVVPGLWVRVIDVPAALQARRYAAPINAVLEVTDSMLSANTGRWHVVGDRTTASCEATSQPADLSMDVRDLGAVYLGGVSLQSLALAGRVTEHQPGALAAASAAFGWEHSPFSHEQF